jgi:hypothetical protein
MWKLGLRPRNSHFPEKKYINGIAVAVYIKNRTADMIQAEYQNTENRST